MDARFPARRLQVAYARGTIVKRFLYFYLMRQTPDRIDQVAPAHVRYWKSQHLTQYLGGPFADLAGGLITFEAGNLLDAQNLVRDDPFQLEDLVEQKWVKEWNLE
jgi:uncharacterized protein YciI